MNRPHAHARLRAALAAALALALAGCRAEAPAPGELADQHHEEHGSGPHGGALVELSDEAIRRAEIGVDSAGPGTIEVSLELPGEIRLDAERSVDVRPAYPGRVVAMHAALGGTVARGEPLATIWSSESLSEYVVRAPMRGTVVARPAGPEAVVDRSSVLCTVADLSTVWLDFPVYVQHLGRIHRGQRVRVRTEGGPEISATGAIAYVGALLDQDTRTAHARVVLPNPDGRWQPGRIVTALVALERVTVPVAVPEDAIVRIGTGAAVFRAGPDGFEVQPVTTGRTDGAVTEIVSGLERGARIASRNALWIKAELEKEAGGDEH